MLVFNCARAALRSAVLRRQLLHVLYRVDCQGLAHPEHNTRWLLNSAAISVYKYVKGIRINSSNKWVTVSEAC